MPINITIHMRKYLLLFGAGAFAVSVFAQKHTGNIYWSTQNNDGNFFDAAGAYSSDGSQENVFTSYDQIDWESCDVFLDARFTGNSDGSGVNHLKGPQNDLTVKSITVTDNWDGSIAGNKANLWWSENGGAKLSAKENFNIYSGIKGHVEAVQMALAVGNDLVIDITASGGGYHGIRFLGIKSLDVGNDFIAKKAGDWVEFTGGDYVKIARNMIVGDSSEGASRISYVTMSGTKGEIEVGGNLVVNNAMHVKLQDSAGLTIGGGITASDAEKFDFWTNGFIRVKEDSTLTNVQEIQMGYARKVDGDGNYVSGGIDFEKNFSFTGGDYVFTYDAGYFKVGGDFRIKDTTQYGGERTGVVNGVKVGGVTVAGSVHAENVNQFNTYDAGFLDVGADLNISARGGGSYADRMGYFKVGRNVNLSNVRYFVENTGYATIAGDLSLSNASSFHGVMKYGQNGSAASFDNPNTFIGGKVIMGGIDNYFEVSFKNDECGGVQYVSTGGFKGVGTLGFTRNEAKADTSRAVFEFRNSDVSDFKGKTEYHNTVGNDALISVDLIMTGSGTQIMRLADESVLRGSIDVRSGKFLLSNAKSVYSEEDQSLRLVVNVKVHSFGAFGAVGADRPLALAEVADTGTAYVNDLEVLDGGSLLFNIGGSGHSAIGVAGRLTLGGGLNIALIGEAGTGTDIAGLLDWADSADAALNDQSMAGALGSGDVMLTINGVEYEIGSWSVNNGLSIVVGSVVPEPAAVAAVLGAFALAFAGLRRRG